MTVCAVREGITSPSNQTAGLQCTIATMEDELSMIDEKGKEVTKEQKEHLYNRIEELK